jgi:hypothetical protein
MVRYAFAIGLAGLVGFGSTAASQAPCGGIPTDQQLARRKTAITTARQINTAEAQAYAKAQKYLPLAFLNTVTVPEGFDVQVSTDGGSYAFLIKDTTDQCQVAIFSDQKGLIYTGTPLR